MSGPPRSLRNRTTVLDNAQSYSPVVGTDFATVTDVLAKTHMHRENNVGSLKGPDISNKLYWKKKNN